jgi:two-component system sensor histidine kinase PilS (NtrC family)
VTPPAGAPAEVEQRRLDRRGTDRRQGDRRSGDRRRDDAAPAAAAGSGWSEVKPGAARPGAALARVQRAYVAMRAALGVALVLALGLSALAGTRLGTSELLAWICLAYALQALLLWLLPRFAAWAMGAFATPDVQRPHRGRWLATTGVDLLAFGSLHAIEGSGGVNFAALLVLPVLMAGVLSPRLLALGTASVAALVLLAVGWQAQGSAGGSAASMVQTGLGGLGLFAVALLAAELAQRLVREEAAALGSLELARQQTALNRLVIEEMVDGVLVVDGRLHVRAANPAARALLVEQGLAPAAPFELALRAAWAPLAEAVARAYADGRWPEAGQDLRLAFAEGQSRTLRLRVRFVQRPGRAEPGAATEIDDAAELPAMVLLLEDVRTAQERLRQDKLAAMGRVSAGVAHEIRNPLAAIAQANALLLEDAQEPAQRRLAGIVADNVLRLKRLVDDVMEVAPGGTPVEQAIDASAAVADFAAEWAAASGVALGPGCALRVELAAAVGVWFDPEHLRRVLVNLLDNALRHASGEPGSVLLLLSTRTPQEAVLSVLSDGAPIPPDVEPHLFEPFFSTRSRGTGLGLYICRELCERYRAGIAYRPRPAAERLRNEFVVTMRRALLHESRDLFPSRS